MAARIEVDGREATSEQLRAFALGGYGHFTAMQVRNGRVRGLDLHLARLAAANRELFDAALDAAAVRDHIRHALGDTADASVRVYGCELGDRPSVIVTTRPPGGMPGGPSWKLQSVPYQRALAHIKHVGDFGQGYYQRLARRNGFDEALLTGPDAVIAEGSITNIGFCDGASIIWPAAPALALNCMVLKFMPRLYRASPQSPCPITCLYGFARIDPRSRADDNGLKQKARKPRLPA